MPDTFGPFVGMLVSQLPYYLVWLVGLILAFVNWSRYPRPALLTTLAVVMMFLASVVYSYLWSESITRRWADGNPDITWMQILTWGHSSVHALGYALLFCAIFSGRQAFASRRFDRRRDEEDDLGEVERSGEPDPGIQKRPRND
jgi:hypothetical protein